VEVKIGVQNVAREIVVDVDMKSDALEKAINSALSGAEPTLSLTDIKGRKVVVASEKLAYIEIGSPASGQVGFRS
jgi:hypothetical protein